MKTPGESFAALADIIKKLRDPETGCPWDKEQTHESLKKYALEETYEVLDAIDNSIDKLPEELGDLLLQIMLHSQIGADEKRFSVVDVVEGLSAKLIKRHPHIFGDVQVKNSDEVLKNWEQIKKEERGEKKGVLSGIPKGMPSLLRSHRIGEKVGRVGFDWPSANEIREKVAEEWKEYLEAASPESKREELGDLLFTLAQLARKEGVDAEELLQAANRKFIGRFEKLEAQFDGELEKQDSKTLNQAWNAIKKAEKP